MLAFFSQLPKFKWPNTICLICTVSFSVQCSSCPPAPHSEMPAPLRGPSWPVEPQLVMLPTLSLKETDFYQTPQSCKEGQAWHLANVFIYLFFFLKAFAPVPGVTPQWYTGSNGPRRRVNTSAWLQKQKQTWCVAFDPTCIEINRCHPSEMET